MTDDLSGTAPNTRRIKYLDMGLKGRISRDAFIQHGTILLLSAGAAIAIACLIFTVSVNRIPIIATGILATTALFLLTCFLVWQCTWVRRLHDVGMSGLWLVSGWGLLILPFIGMVFSSNPHVWWLLLPSAIVGIRLQIAAFSPGELGPNRYGPSSVEASES